MLKRWIIIDVIVASLLGLLFGLLFFTQHAWGSWGDDSPGYIYTAGQFIKGETLVVQDDLVKSALDKFGDEKLARFAAPTHHTIISPSGWMASKYPIGLSWLMYIAAAVTQNDEIIYSVVPMCAVLVVLATYFFTLVWLKQNPALKRACALMASLSVGFASLFANYAVSQPMRDIPALLFFLLSGITLGIVLNYSPSKHWSKYVLIVVSGLLFGFGMNIRETNILLLLPLCIVWFLNGTKTERKKILYQIIVFMVSVMIAFSLSLWNSYTITLHKEKFRQHDITSIAITSNIDHIQSLSITNIYNNQGKFKPGIGGAQQYWNIMQQFSYWPPFILFALIGIVALFKKQPQLAWLLSTWSGTVFILFSMWINPYPRYILALLPAVAIASAYGTIATLELLKRILQLTRWQWATLTIALIVSFFVALQPSLAEQREYIINQQYVNKAIARSDLHMLKQLANDLPDSENPPLLIMLGSWKPGISETIMTHSSGLRVIRFPSLPQEQPPIDQLADFIKDSGQTYDVYIWYDITANRAEQDFLKYFQLTPWKSYVFTFEEGVQIYKAK